MQKERLTGLDGLRGLAALSVILSHIGFNIASIINIPFVIVSYRTLAVGPNSVQIFFVLSGFLMAFLYTKISNIQNFIKKRYARIIPIYAVVVLFIGIDKMTKMMLPWYIQFFVLISLAIIFNIGWKIISRFDRKKIFGNLIFYGFIFLQIVMLVFNLFITPKLIVNHAFIISDLKKHILFILSNLTLTTHFVRDVERYSTVFWSLAAELYFYILYPFIVIPLINLGKRYGWIFGAIIVFSMTKIVFDLDEVIRGLFTMSNINISRTNGFIVGVLIGTVYESKSILWQKLQSIFSRLWVNVLLLIALILIQAGDWSVRDGQNIWFMNQYYLLSSWIFGLIIIAAIIPNTLIQKIFSHKILVFFGLISYSLYLTHINISSWVSPVAKIFAQFVENKQILAILEFSIYILINILTSYLLYRLVESLYFQSRSKKEAKKILQKQTHVETSSPKYKLIKVFGVTALIMFILWLYTGNYSPTLFVANHDFPNTAFSDYFINRKISLLEKGKVKITLKSKYDNLSVVTFRLWYYKNADVTRSHNKKPAMLYFRLYEENSGKPIFESSRSAFEIEGEPNFPFGINTIPDSENKNYFVELELVGGAKEDDILVNLSPASIVTTYAFEKDYLIKNPHQLIVNRLGFVLSRPDSLFAFAFIAFVVALQKMRRG